MKSRKKTPITNQSLKLIPSIHELLKDPSLKNVKMSQQYVKRIVNVVVQNWRHNLGKGKVAGQIKRESLREKIVSEVLHKIDQFTCFSMRRVVNGTGIILHTNLGRAPLAEMSREHLQAVIENYCNLEINLKTGQRGDRIDLVEEVLCLITGAESAVVVNNNAAAVLLMLNSLCKNKEVPVSRGELVEIGGSFRMPEVMKAGQVKMVEVGTTNKTHLADYESAISPGTGAILKVHTSNYRVMGFAGNVPVSHLIPLVRKNRLPLLYDMGSGAIEDLKDWGFAEEPVAREYISAGVDVISFSADKILGGPQAGIIIGKKEYLSKIKKNHLLRALRCDKLTYALLDATLRMYLNPDDLKSHLPVCQMLNLTPEQMRQTARELINQVKDLPMKIEWVESYSQMGSGALPLEKIPSLSVKMKPEKMTVQSFARKLRLGDPPVIGYIEADHYHLNLQTIRKDEIPLVVKSIGKLLT